MPKVDFGKLPTEQSNPRSTQIDSASFEEILTLMNQEDLKVIHAVSRVKPAIAKGAELISQSLKDGGKLFFVGAGTSGRLGVIEAAECPPTFNTPTSLVQALMAGGKSAVFQSKEGAEDQFEEGCRLIQKKIKKGDVVCGIAASGVTPYVAGAIKAAKKKGARTLLLCCNPAPTLAKSVDCLIAPKVGPEIISGSTRLKAGTATKLILNMLTVASMIRLGKVYRNWMVDLQPKSKKLKARALRLIERLGKVKSKEAEKLLLEARNQVKVAILMGRKGWKYSTAVSELKKANGFLKKALLHA